MKRRVTVELDLPDVEYSRDGGKTWQPFSWAQQFNEWKKPLTEHRLDMLRACIKRLESGEKVDTLEQMVRKRGLIDD